MWSKPIENYSLFTRLRANSDTSVRGLNMNRKRLHEISKSGSVKRGECVSGVIQSLPDFFILGFADFGDQPD